MFIATRRAFRGWRPAAVRTWVAAAAIGLVALVAAPGTGAAMPAQPAAPKAAAAGPAAVITGGPQGKTQCVPSGTGDLGLTCTGTFSGNTAFDPWTWSNLPAADQPVVTVSQAMDLTDQSITVSWTNFTPSIGSAGEEPNPATDSASYQVSLFECNGASPDASEEYADDCYTAPVGSTQAEADMGPANAEVETTLDTGVPAGTPAIGASGVFSDYSPLLAAIGQPLPANFDNTPGHWTGQATFHVEAPTPRTAGGFFNCGATSPCSLVIDPNWGGTPASQAGAACPSNPVRASAGCATNTSLCNDHYIGAGFDPRPPLTTTADPDPENPARGDLPFNTFDVPDFGQSTATDAAAEPLSPIQNNGACWTADRIVIPLSFAETPADCPDQTPAFAAQGSPMLENQMLQWETGICSGASPVAVSNTFISESVARADFLSPDQSAGSRVDMALVTLPPDASQTTSRQFTYAPLANSGTGIAFNLDDWSSGTPVQSMVLNPQLLAKLTTQSYTLQYNCAQAAPPPWQPAPQANESCDPAVLGNPVSLFGDKEFLSLNSDCQPVGQAAGHACVQGSGLQIAGTATGDFPPDTTVNAITFSDEVANGGFLPTVLAGNSDMTYDLTGWIGANPDAASFLAGQPDSGTRVNSNYLGISYPEQAFTQLDEGVSFPGGLPACDVAMQCSNDLGLTDSTMNATWNFQTNLNQIASDLLTNKPTADSGMTSCVATDVNSSTGTVCPSDVFNPMTSLNPELPGSVALLSQLDLGDIGNYGFPAASLVNAAGKAVAPTQASVEAAVSQMKTNPDGITQFFTDSTSDATAYPLSMVDYAMVPTCGLPASEASAISQFLTMVATTGQVQGGLPGQLGPGYYPLTAAQDAQTRAAAAAVKSQDCTSPPKDNTVSGMKVSDVGPRGPAAASGPAGIPSASPAVATVTAPLAGHAAAGATPRTSVAQPAGVPYSPGAAAAQPAAFGTKSADSGLSGTLLALSVAGGAVLLAGGPAAWAITATGQWPAVLGWLEPARRRLRALRVRRAA